MPSRSRERFSGVRYWETTEIHGRPYNPNDQDQSSPLVWRMKILQGLHDHAGGLGRRGGHNLCRRFIVVVLRTVLFLFPLFRHDCQAEGLDYHGVHGQRI